MPWAVRSLQKESAVEGGGDGTPPSGAAMAAAEVLKKLTLGDLRAILYLLTSAV